jgi:hypothetical protein
MAFYHVSMVGTPILTAMKALRAAMVAVICFLAGCSKLLGSTYDEGVLDAVTAPDVIMPHPSRLDILVIVPDYKDASSIIAFTARATQIVVSQILDPSDKRPVRDLHFGVVSSKIDSNSYCITMQNNVDNDGTLLLPDDLPVDVTATNPYLTQDDLVSKDGSVTSRLDFYYVAHFPAEGYCNVTQFLESASLAIDGRNKGFVRSDSLLLTLIFAGIEDCSTKNESFWPTVPQTGGPLLYEWCYNPPSDFLYSVEHYVEKLGKRRPNGITLVAIAGKDGSATLLDTGANNSHLVYYCDGYFAPTPRLASLVRKLNALGDPRVEAQLFDYCPIKQGKFDSMKSLASHILSLMLR